MGEYALTSSRLPKLHYSHQKVSKHKVKRQADMTGQLSGRIVGYDCKAAEAGHEANVPGEPGVVSECLYDPKVSFLKSQ